MKQKIIVVDGHDGSGKTTIAHKIASYYNMKYVKPFSDSLGDLIAWSYRNKNFKFANDMAIMAIQKIKNENENNDLVFDRHWLSMFTVLPEKYHAMWERPITICCWADVKTTQQRLIDRNEDQGQEWNHKLFCELYQKYAKKYNVKIIDTSCNDNINYNMTLIYKYLEEQYGWK